MGRRHNQKKNKLKRQKQPLLTRDVIPISGNNSSAPPIKKKNNIIFSTVRLLWTIVGILSTLFGLIIIKPDLQVSVGNSIDPNNPFKTLIIIKNGGFFDIADVNYSCFIEDLRISSGALGGVSTLEVDPGLDPIPLIESGESYTENFQFDRILNLGSYKLERTTSADINFIFSYKYLYIIPCHKTFRFIGGKNSDNGFVWVERPVDDRVKNLRGNTKFKRGPQARRQSPFVK